MSNFLQMSPRRLPVALADYVALTERSELRRCAIARRIYAALPTEQQAETSRIYEAMNVNAKLTGGLPAGGTVVAFHGYWSKLKRTR